MLDAITETISHFIGHFHLSTEGARLRSDYERFRHERAKAEELPPFEPDASEATNYELEGYRPNLDWRPDGEDAEASQELPNRPDPAMLPAVAVSEIELHRPVVEEPVVARAEPGPGPVPELALPPPGSLATVTVQVATLIDDDVFGDITGLAGPESFAPDLAQMVAAAHDLSTMEIPQPTGEAPWSGAAAAIKAQVATAAEGDAAGRPEGATIATVTGDAATGIMVNGKAVDSMPTLADHLPAFHSPTEDGADGEEGTLGDLAEGQAPGAAVPSDAGTGGLDGPDTPAQSGHEVIAGGNAAINEVVLSTNWLDAAVIAVKGDVTQITSISQVNVLSDGDDLGPQAPSAVPSEILNAAQIDGVAGPEAVAGPDGLPPTCNVTCIEGDFINFNWVQQTSFITDHDRAVITSTGSSTHIGLGANEVVNAAFLGEWGYQYDLILIGGNMVDVSAVTQTNVLLDDDHVVGGSASGGDNLLFNGASITTTGTDSFGELTSTFEDALDAMAEGAASVPSLVAQDPLFTGLGALNVLYIAGDFVTMNLIEQVNVMGDNDQVTLAAEAALANPGGEVEVIAGSNLLANTATIHDGGLDSVVMAGGDIYTDALIHQAELVSPDASPTGVAQAAQPALASEAVVFLADGMIDAPGVAEANLAPAAMDGGGADLMQTMLS